MQLPHPVHTFTYSHIHTFTHSHTHTNTHTHTFTGTTRTTRTHVLIERRVGFVIVAKRASRISGTQTMRIRENQSTKCVFAGPHQSCHKQKSTAQTQTLGRTSRHISPHTAQRAYMYAICNYPKHTFPPLRYQVHRQYDNLASFPRTCAVGHPSRVSQHMNVFEPVRVVTSSPCLAPLFYITARSFETRKREAMRSDAAE